jgi:hypothetical protein
MLPAFCLLKVQKCFLCFGYKILKSLLLSLKGPKMPKWPTKVQCLSSGVIWAETHLCANGEKEGEEASWRTDFGIADAFGTFLARALLFAWLFSWKALRQFMCQKTP